MRLATRDLHLSLIQRLRTPLDIPLLLFLASALIGVWASYDRSVSWSKFSLLALAVALYYAIAWSPRIFVDTFIWLLLFFAAALAIYFSTQHDYAVQPGKLDLINQIGLFLKRSTPQLNGYQPHPNIISGVLEIALPINAAQLVSILRSSSASRLRSRIAFLASLFSFLLIAFGLLMTSSRGAWLALALVGGMFLVGAFWRDAARRYAMPLVLIVIVLSLIAVLRLGSAFWPTVDNLLGAIPAGEQVVSRLDIYRQSWGLIQDYYFTGSGLGVFSMVYSTYALLIQVPFLTHAHNLFLQVWIEQGLLGFIAFIWLVIEFYLQFVPRPSSLVSRPSSLSWLALGGLAATTVMLLHGMVDVLIYSSRPMPLLFVPMALAVASVKWAVDSAQSPVGSSPKAQIALPKPHFAFRNSQFAIGFIVLSAFCLLLTFFWRPLSAMWYANLGSVAQTRIELAAYAFPDRLVEYTRKSADLSEAESFFNQALAFDRGNVTANQRLGALALARAQYNAAQGYLEPAYARDPGNVVTWQLLGDAYLAQGRMDEAYAFWSRVDGAASKLDIEASVRYDPIGDRERAARTRTLAQRLRASH